MAVIIGKPGRNIPEAQAMQHVFGFAVINDTTARDLQMNHGGQWFKGKSLDGHGPIGPWIVPASDIDYNDLRLTTTVNGVLKQDINTSQMYFKVPRLIAELSLGHGAGAGRYHRDGHPFRRRRCAANRPNTSSQGTCWKPRSTGSGPSGMSFEPFQPSILLHRGRALDYRPS